MNKTVNLRSLTTRRMRLEYLYERAGRPNVSQLCEDYYISRSTFYRILKGKGERSSRETLDGFARAFNVSLDFLDKGGDRLGHYVDSGNVISDKYFRNVDFVIDDQVLGRMIVENTPSEIAEFFKECDSKQKKVMIYVIRLLRIIKRVMNV